MFHILLVDNDKSLAKRLQQNIHEQSNYQAHIAHNYKEAVECLEQHHIAFAIIDIDLEDGKTGIDLAEYINKHYAILFMFFSAHVDRDNKYYRQALATEPINYIHKAELLPKSILHYIHFNIDRYAKGNPVLLSTNKEGLLIGNSIMLKLNDHWDKIRIDNIEHISVVTVYSAIHLTTPHAPYKIKISLDKLMEQLSLLPIARVNQSQAVNIHLIQQYLPAEQKIILFNQKEFHVTRTYKDHLQKLLPQVK